MKILFDFRSYQISARRGIGRYFLSLYEQLVKYPEVEASLLLTKQEEIDLPSNIISHTPIYLLEKFENYDIQENFDFLFKGNFFDLCNNMIEKQYPFEVIEKCNNIVGITHDLIPLIFSGNYLKHPEEMWKYTQAMETMSLACHLFANSEATKKDTAELLEYEQNNISVIYGGADVQKFHTKNSDKKYIHKERKNNIVFVCGADLRKNFTGAARAFSIAYSKKKLPSDAKLYLICASSDWFNKEVKKAIAGYPVKIGKQIIITNYITDEEMVNLLGTAKASIFPSFYEGLGLPILESYIAGTPCFASNLSSTKEFVSEECSFDPYNEEEMSDMIVKIFNDEKLCQRSLQYGRTLLKKINWEHAAEIVIKKLRDLLLQKNYNEKVAVFSCLPPSASGIAQFSYRTHTIHQDKFDLIGNIESLEDYKNLLNEDLVLNFDARNLSSEYENCFDTEKNVFIFHNFDERKIVSYGPYVTLKKGKYSLQIEYELSENSHADFRLTSQCGNVELMSGKLAANKNICSTNFELFSDTRDIELQTFFVGKGKFSLKNMKIILLKPYPNLSKINNIIPYNTYPFMHLYTKYLGKIFVIGNSEHHNESLMEAIKSKGEKNRLLYLHEAFILFAFYPMLNFDEEKIKEFIIQWYPFLYQDIINCNIANFYSVLREHNVGGIKPLLALTGIKNIAVNSTKAKEMIESELTMKEKEEVRINVLFHPIPNLLYVSPIHIKKQKNELIIGSFGMPSFLKYTDSLILAIQELNQRGYKIRLLLAGYKAKQWLSENRYNIDKLNITCMDNPDDNTLLSLMKTVDLAVQLRKNPHGESSGCIAQLLGMNQKVLTNKNFILPELEKFCTTIPENCTIEEIKQGILEALKKDKQSNVLYKKLSYSNLSDDLYNLVLQE